MRLKVKHFLWFCLLLPPWLGWVTYEIVTWPAMPPAAEWAPLAPELWAEGVFSDFSESEVLAWQGRDIGEGKKEDVEPKAIWRMDVRQFLGDPSVSSVRVDLDRDTFYDGHFHLSEDKVTLDWSSQDDENYDQYLLWEGNGWVSTIRPAKEGGGEVRVSEPVQAVLAWDGRKPSPDVGLDVTPETDWRIDLVHANGDISQVLLDLDRDGLFDQRWDFTQDPKVVRVFHDDDGVAETVYTWNGSRLVAGP